MYFSKKKSYFQLICKKTFQKALDRLYQSPSCNRYKYKTKRHKVKAIQKVVQNYLPEKPIHNPANKLKKKKKIKSKEDIQDNFFISIFAKNV